MRTAIVLFLTCICGCNQNSNDDMTTFSIDYDAFTFDEYFYIGKHDVPWLDMTANFIIDTEDSPIPDVHRELVAFACRLLSSTRDKLERYIYDEYQSEIYGSISGGDDITPPISKPSDIWTLLSAPGIHTPPDHRIESDCQFTVTFECVWDPEYGLSILFDDKGDPIDIGGQGHHF